MRSLYSGVSGMRSLQTRMDVIGNNIANVNTTGFKGSRVTFTDVMSQTLSSGSLNTNPQQIGLGVGVGSTDLITDDGAFQMTGRALDLAIQGAGLFALKGSSGETLYTRAGGFDWNAEGYLISPANGMRVQGWMVDPTTGKIGRTDAGTLTDLRMIRGDVSLGKPSTAATLKGNLDAAAVADTTSRYETVLTAYDSLGRPQGVVLRFEKTGTAPDTWSWKYALSTAIPSPVDPDDPDAGFATGGDLNFNPDGSLKFDPTVETEYMGTMTFDAADLPGADTLTVKVDFRKVTQAFAAASGTDSNSTVEIDSIDGYKMGTLESVSVNDSGILTGRFSNGTSRTLGQIAVANFNNMAGLMKVGGSTFAESPASGVPQVGTAKTGGRGGLLPGNLEGSNVDLATEFTNMILTQRGFQANSKTVSTADDMLQEVINLRR